MSETKTKMINTFKYAGSSGLIGLSLVQVMIFYQPELKEISEPLTVLVSFFANLILVRTGVISDG